MYYKAPFGYILLGGVFLLVDRFFKWQALNAWSAPNPVDEYLGWEPFLNGGIAFGIILPPFLVLFSSIIIIGIFGYFFYRHFSLPNRAAGLNQGIGLTLILAGASSNLVDRILYQQTIDYLRIFTGVVNLADGLIVTGFVLYFWSLRQVK